MIATRLPGFSSPSMSFFGAVILRLLANPEPFDRLSVALGGDYRGRDDRDRADLQPADGVDVRVLGVLVEHFADEFGAFGTHRGHLPVDEVLALGPGRQREQLPRRYASEGPLLEEFEQPLFGVGPGALTKRQKGYVRASRSSSLLRSVYRRNSAGDTGDRDAGSPELRWRKGYRHRVQPHARPSFTSVPVNSRPILTSVAT
jgi:hypothetical protein